tara:strand:+ start:2708 stop:3433 length:726 start_codon:yes stop_codon:yes gene_type:complete
MNLFKWHNNIANKTMRNLGISNYQALWLAFIKGIIIGAAIIFFISCSKQSKDNIIHQIVDEEYVVIRDVATLQTSNDPISSHIDSILSGFINTTIISTGQKGLDLDGDESTDLYFEIIDLQPYNPGGLPTHFDSLAARAGSSSIQFLDNSTWHYADALNQNNLIDNSQHFSSDNIVLGTFMNSGQFNGHGNKYLGIRIPNGNDYNYGWVKLYCSEHNDTLRILEYAYNETINNSILAGETQ